MGGVLLFCISEAAKPFVQQALNARWADGDARMFYLVESRTCPDNAEGFKEELQDVEAFSSEFIGASVQECQNWALQNWFQVNFIEQDFIAIADARSAVDNTLVVQFYGRALDPEDPVEFEGFGVLPHESDTWVEWRIEPRWACWVFSDLTHGALEMSYPVYLGLKEELTDENGVFDAAEAQRLVCGSPKELLRRRRLD
ncbi:hypothetical protein L207DRAFT_573147 [Hyaloscypha variabilis F]|uniref:Uncharacterized protein n=1 Tax=Hyaloscypha variabilis (strain UAMH 11265 / GT02V1 / F) TaxID=1149755 RepID=A0A2J6QXS7_HYAVF|nr:hypothetical protein L207DRAFT_573147 [Hyaloscypha variabilis F]